MSWRSDYKQMVQAEIEQFRHDPLAGCTCSPSPLPINRDDRRWLRRDPGRAVFFYAHQKHCKLGRLLSEVRRERDRYHD